MTYLNSRQQVLPPLTNAYEEHGYAAGYLRGVNDMLTEILEATDEFARFQPSPADSRRMLHAFSKFIEQRLGRPRRQIDQEFVEGLGI